MRNIQAGDLNGVFADPLSSGAGTSLQGLATPMAGWLATDFGTTDDGGLSLAVQADGKIVVAGFSDSSFALARYNPGDGSLDSGFSGDGTLTTRFGPGGAGASSVTIQADGKLLVAGSSDGDFALARYKPNGNLDQSFGEGGTLTTDFGPASDRSLLAAVQANGKILAIGVSDGGLALARYKPDGSLDTRFSADGKLTVKLEGDGYITAAAVQADGKILVAGQVRFEIDGHYDEDFLLARYTPNGKLDRSFGNGGTLTTGIRAYDQSEDLPCGIALQADGKILVAGSSWTDSNSQDFALARYTADGHLDQSFAAGTGKLMTDFDYSFDDGRSVALQADGKILMAGWHNSSLALVRYTANGNLDYTFGSEGKRVIEEIVAFNGGKLSLAVQADGKILVSGVRWNGADNDFFVARLNADGHLDPSFGDRLPGVAAADALSGFSATDSDPQADFAIGLPGVAALTGNEFIF